MSHTEPEKISRDMDVKAHANTSTHKHAYKSTSTHYQKLKKQAKNKKKKIRRTDTATTIQNSGTRKQWLRIPRTKTSLSAQEKHHC